MLNALACCRTDAPGSKRMPKAVAKANISAQSVSATHFWSQFHCLSNVELSVTFTVGNYSPNRSSVGVCDDE